MNTERALLAALVFALGCGSAHAQETAPAAVAPAPTISTRPEFHAALAPFGAWLTLAPYGEVWCPRDMPAGWRPYTTGRWVYADAAGWTWVADEPWGWAPFHYGRWTLDANLGWVWIPGDVWGPAWVAWREGDGITGWAPLPPTVGWAAGVGLTCGSVDLAVAIGEPWWSFVPVARLCHPHVCDVMLLRDHAAVVLRETRLVRTGITLERGVPVNRPVRVEAVEQASGASVPHVALRMVEHADALHGTPLAPNEIAVLRPPAPGAKIASAPRSSSLPPTPKATQRAARTSPAGVAKAPASRLAVTKVPPPPPRSQPGTAHRPAGGRAHHRRHPPVHSKPEPGEHHAAVGPGHADRG